MKFIFKIVAAFNSISGAMLFRWSLFWGAAILCILFYGCGLVTDYMVITYYPQDNVARFEEAGNIEVKVKVNDLRSEARNLRSENEVGTKPAALIIAKNDLRELTAHAIETELMNRGFKLGDGVLVGVDLVKFYAYFWSQAWERTECVAELILHIDVKKSDGTIKYSKKIRGTGFNPNLYILGGENARIALDAALKDGISRLVNDPEFIVALIKASR
jgi:uncharacterized lipoprotein YajG